MCISSEVSLLAFFFVLIFSIFNCWYFNCNKKVIALSLIIVFISLVQLVEFFAWNFQNIDDPEIRLKNNLTSRFGALVLYLQPVVIFFVLVYYSSNVSEDSPGNISKYLALLFLIIYLFNIIPRIIELPDKELTMVGGCNSRIVYSWDSGVNGLYLPAMIIVILLLLRPRSLALKTVLIFIASLIISAILVYSQTYNLSDTEDQVPSMWCLLAFTGPLFIFLYFRNENYDRIS